MSRRAGFSPASKADENDDAASGFAATPRVSRANDAAASTRRTLTQVNEYAIELARGEQAVISPQRPIVRTVLEDPEKATAWTERRLIFEETPLSAVTAEFARYYTAKIIRIADPKLAELHITGVFDATDPGSLVTFLRTFGAVDIRERHLFVDVASEHSNGIISKLNRTRIKGQKLKVKVA
jgi:ferric-dicitrate binding protein FerR (iron transport regulator)